MLSAAYISILCPGRHMIDVPGKAEKVVDATPLSARLP
jgi:hypothetical protein